MWAFFVYLVYGLAFIALGLVMALAARTPLPVLPRRAHWLLAGFGFAHGTVEWLQLASRHQQCAAGGPWADRLLAMRPGLNALSFALLMQAGLEVLVERKRAPGWLRFAPLALLVAWTSFVLLAWPPVGAGPWTNQASALCRYLLGFGGAELTAVALWGVASAPFAIEVQNNQRIVYLAAASLAAYGVLAGLVVEPSTLLLGRWINSETFVVRLGFPVEILRTAVALTFAGLMAEASVVQTAWLQQSIDRRREEFISVVAHDLRGPLSSIALATGALERLAPAQHQTERERSLITSILGSSKRMNRMIPDLLDASRIEASRLEVRKEPMELMALLSAIVERAAQMTRGHPVKLVGPDQAVIANLDAARIEQVLDNLLSNAAKYSFERAEILLELVAHPSFVQISVVNRGPGISREDAALLFTRFHRGKSVREGKVEGLGLGLYISKGLVQAHGGKIWAESQPGTFTVFRFTLPRE